MKIVFVVVALLFGNKIAFSQERVPINSQYGISVSYELTKIEESKKKDRYVIIVKAENTTDKDLYYSVPLTNNPNGVKEVGLLTNRVFSQVEVRNSTSMFGTFVDLKGIETDINTKDNKRLFTIRKGEFITNEKEFSVKSGTKPIVTNTFLLPFNPSTFFQPAVDNKVLDGSWVSNCGNVSMTLNYSVAQNGSEMLAQTINGNRIIYKKISSTSYEKFNDTNVTLTYDEATNQFTYSTKDGVVCVWKKVVN